MYRSIAYAELRRLLDAGAQLVEVLPEHEYREEHLPGAISIPLKTLDAATSAHLDRARPVIVYCWDALCDMSPRAAERLVTLGFAQVYDYVESKVDWLARGLPTEGEPLPKRAIDVLAKDAVTCSLSDAAVGIRDRIASSRYGFALVLSHRGVLLGRVRASSLADAEDAALAEALMEPGPSTIQAHEPLDPLAQRMRSRELTSLPVTTPDGVLLGVIRREAAEAGLSGTP
jgi:rhodanese-related sulfurtransferase